MQPRRDFIPLRCWLLIGLLLFVFGGCVAPDGSLMRFQQAPYGSIVGWQIGQPAQVTAPNTVLSLASERSTPGPVRPILYSESTENGPSIHAVDLDGTALGTWERAELLGWSPQGDRFAYLTVDISTLAVQLAIAAPGEEGEVIVAFNPEDRVFTGRPSIWSPDGTRIALVVWRADEFGLPMSMLVVLIDAASGELVQEFDLLTLCRDNSDNCVEPGPTFAKWSPDGHKLLLGGWSVASLDTTDGKMEPILNLVEGLVIGDGYLQHSEVYWLPSGDGVLSVHYAYGDGGMSDPGQEEITIKYLGQESTQLLTQEQLIALGIDVQKMLLIRISPSGTYLALADSNHDGEWSNLLILDLAELQNNLLANVRDVNPIAKWKFPGMIGAIEWSPDEAALAFLLMSDEGGTVEVLQISTDTSQSVAEVSLNREQYAYGYIWMWNRNLVSWTP